MEEEGDPVRSGAALDWRTTATALAAALLLVARPAPAQEAGPVSVDSADALRAAAERPPGSHPFDGWDAASLPLDIAFLPVRLVSEGIEYLAGEAFRPRQAGLLTRTYRSLRRWGLDLDVESVGPRSGPGLEARLERYDPFFVWTAMTARTSQVHAAGFSFGDPVPLVTDVELGDPLDLGGPPEEGESWGVEAAGAFRRFAEPHFWGVGPDSRAVDESDFRWDQWRAAAAGSYRTRHVGFRAGIGWEENQVAAGLDGSTPDLTSRLDASDLFGADERTRFLRLELRGVLDFTRWEQLQQRGFRLEAGPTVFRGVGGTPSDFVRWDVTATGYLPVNRRQEFVLHGIGAFHSGVEGRGIPFTHLASLGGDRGLRGFSTDRFRDRHMAALMTEWRYEIWREKHGGARIEGLAFVDAGTVAPEFDRLTDADLETSWGLGARLLASDDVALMGYVGLGGEETRLSLETSWDY